MRTSVNHLCRLCVLRDNAGTSPTYEIASWRITLPPENTGRTSTIVDSLIYGDKDDLSNGISPTEIQ